MIEDRRDTRDPQLLGQEYTRLRLRGVPASEACLADVPSYQQDAPEHAYIRELRERTAAGDRFAASFLAHYEAHGTFQGMLGEPVDG